MSWQPDGSGHSCEKILVLLENHRFSGSHDQCFAVWFGYHWPANTDTLVIILQRRYIMSTSVRPVSATDRIVWEQLFNSYAEFYNTTIPAQGTSSGLDVVWGWIFDPDNQFWCDVAERDGKIIGFMQYQLMHRSLGAGMVCYLSDLYVNPSVRGSGAGRAMIDHVLQFSKDRGLPGVRWLTQENNYTARRLYDAYSSKTDFILYNVPA